MTTDIAHYEDLKLAVVSHRAGDRSPRFGHALRRDHSGGSSLVGGLDLGRGPQERGRGKKLEWREHRWQSYGVSSLTVDPTNSSVVYAQTGPVDCSESYDC